MEGYILRKYTKEAWEKGDIQGRQTVVILSFALRSMIDFCSQLTFWTCSPPSSVQPLRVLQKHQNMLSLPSLCHEMGFMRTVFKSIVKSEVILAVLFNIIYYFGIRHKYYSLFHP